MWVCKLCCFCILVSCFVLTHTCDTDLLRPARHVANLLLPATTLGTRLARTSSAPAPGAERFIPNKTTMSRYVHIHAQDPCFPLADTKQQVVLVMEPAAIKELKLQTQEVKLSSPTMLLLVAAKYVIL